MAERKQRALGANQERVLRSLVERGGWSEGFGWMWDTHANTRRILDTLVKRGLAIKETRVRRLPPRHLPVKYDFYQATDEGAALSGVERRAKF